MAGDEDKFLIEVRRGKLVVSLHQDTISPNCITSFIRCIKNKIEQYQQIMNIIYTELVVTGNGYVISPGKEDTINKAAVGTNFWRAGF